jgi:heavy metal sensor kinase
MASWYTAFLAGFLVLFGIALYVGLRTYLEKTLRASLSEEAGAITEEIIEHDSQGRTSTLASLLSERFAPQLNDRFIRVTDQSGKVVFSSAKSADGVLDPTLVPPVARDADQEYGAERFLPNGKRVIVQILPTLSKSGLIFVEVGSLYQPVEQVLEGLLLTITIGFPILVALATIGGHFLTKRALAPLREIAGHAERISSTNLFERMPVPNTGDELQQLTVAVNKMMGRLEKAFEHVNRFSADVAHELRTPLTILQGELEATVQDERLTPELLDVIGSALEETERMRTIVEQLLAIARLDSGDAPIAKVELDLGEIVATVAEQMRVLAEEKAITLACLRPEIVSVEGDASRLKQIVVNILDNAIRYTQHGGAVTVAVTREVNWGVITVTDNGCGISPGALPHVFERFYRADTARTRYSGGAGLGLSIVKAICSAHQGEVTISSTEGAGTTVILRLPVESSRLKVGVADQDRRSAAMVK